jgi:hypothetical protein
MPVLEAVSQATLEDGSCSRHASSYVTGKCVGKKGVEQINHTVLTMASET